MVGWYCQQVRGTKNAGVAQLVEHNVANVVVVGSNPITRSSLACRFCRPFWRFPTLNGSLNFKCPLEMPLGLGSHCHLSGFDYGTKQLWPARKRISTEETTLDVPKLQYEVKVDKISACERHVVVTIGRSEIDRYYKTSFR